MLTNRTPPNCIQANIYAMARVLFPNQNIVIELPSLKHIKNLQTVLSLITKSLAAYSLGNAKVWKQLHMDDTERRRKSLVNVVMTLLDNDYYLKTICLSGLIIAKDKSSEKQSRSVISYFDEAGRLLKGWRDKTAEMYPNEPELLEQLPVPKDVTVTRLIGGMVSHDNCHGANKAVTLLADDIIEIGK